MAEKDIINTLEQGYKEIIDPEIGINIVDLGLIYDIQLLEADKIRVVMTVTTPGCPMTNYLQTAVMKKTAEEFPDMRNEVELVFEPAWNTDMISEEGKKELGY